MNGYERIAAALDGRLADGVPVMLHNFLMAAREAGMSQADYRSDPAATAEAHIRAVEKYGYDGVVLDIDTTALAGAVGVRVDEPPDQPAHCDAAGMLAELRDVAGLKPVDLLANRKIAVWLETARRLVDHFKGQVHVRGNCDQAPFSLACVVRGTENFLAELMDEDKHADIDRLVEYCLQVVVDFIRLMAETGVDSLSNGDSLAGPAMISPAMHRRFAAQSERAVVEAAHATGKKYILHVCGNATPILDQLAGLGIDGLELDYLTDVKHAKAVLQEQVTFIGNIDPAGVLALGSVGTVEKATDELLAIYGTSPRFILNAGCAIPADTPPENLRAMLARARGFR